MTDLERMREWYDLTACEIVVKSGKGKSFRPENEYIPISMNNVAWLITHAENLTKEVEELKVKLNLFDGGKL